MFKYYLNSIAYNKKRHLLILGISIVGFSFIFLILQLLNSLKLIAEAESDYIQMIYMIIVFFVLIGVSVIGFLNTAYKIIYQGRKLEIQNLRNIGCSKRTIKRIFLTEIIILNVMVSLCSIIVGSILSKIFTEYYHETMTMDVKFIVVFLLSTSVIFLCTVYHQFFIYLREALDLQERRHKTDKRVRKTVSVQTKMMRRVIISLFLIMLYFIVKLVVGEYLTIFEYVNIKQLDLLVLIMICYICRKPIVYLMFTLIYKVAENLYISNLLLAMKRIIHDMERMMKLIANLALSICFMILFLVMFQSTSTSSVKYIQRSLKYQHLYVDETMTHSDVFINNEPAVLSGSLILPAAVDINNKRRQITLKGVAHTHQRAETVEMIEGSWKSLFQESVEFLPILISNIDANNYGLSIDDYINSQVSGVIIRLKVVGIYNSFRFAEIYADQKKLSLWVSQEPNKINTWYTDIAVNGYEEFGIIHKSVDEIKDETEDNILKGTEIIHAFLYLYVLGSMFMLFNIYLITLKERRLSNQNLLTFGLREQRIFRIQFLEIFIVTALGIITGILLGMISVQGLPALLRLIFNLRIQIYIPKSVGFIISGIILCSLMEIVTICHNSTKTEYRLEEEAVS